MLYFKNTLQAFLWVREPLISNKLIRTEAWFPYDRNHRKDRSDRNSAIAAILAISGFQVIARIARRWTSRSSIEIFLSLRSQSQRWHRSQRSLSIPFPYNLNDRSDHCDRCTAILAIIWKPGLVLETSALSSFAVAIGLLPTRLIPNFRLSLPHHSSLRNLTFQSFLLASLD